MKKLFFLGFYFLLLNLHAQTYNMTNGTVNTCSGTFYDSGGSAGNYVINENKTMTFCSNDPAKAILINFTSFNTESGFDKLSIYNGPSTASPLIGTFSGTTTIPSSYYSSIGGCLTFKFVSDNTTVKPGWAASISCSATLPNNDCINKKALCGTTSLTDNNSGPGMVNDLVDAPAAGANSGCYLSVGSEYEASWYSFTMANNGTFDFVIDPGPTSPDDFDFILWGPNPTCPPTAQPIRCSASCYNTDPLSTCVPSAPNNKTGLRSSSLDTTEAIGAGGDGFVKTLNVLAGQNYILLVMNASKTNSGFTISFGGTASLTNCASVPIQLISFKAKTTRNKKVNLEWKVGTEVNCDYYQIERSKDGKNFTAIRDIKGKANPNTITIYNATDNSPFEGTSYYRLKEVDKDGTVSYFNIETVNVEEENKISVSVFPNPVHEAGELNLQIFNGNDNFKITYIELVDLDGRLIYKSEENLKPGMNDLTIDLKASKINFSIGLLKVLTSENLISRKVVIDKQ